MAKGNIDWTDQDKLNRAYYQREEGMNVTRMFLFIFIGFGALVGFMALVTPEAGSASQPVVRMNARCLLVPGLVVAYLILSRLRIGITGSWDERREVKQMESTRRDQQKIEEAPVDVSIRVINEHRTDSGKDYIKEMNERKKRQQQAAAEKRRKRNEKYAQQDRVRAAQADRAISNAIATMQPSIGNRIAKAKLIEEPFGTDHVEIE